MHQPGAIHGAVADPELTAELLVLRGEEQFFAKRREFIELRRDWAAKIGNELDERARAFIRAVGDP